MTAVHERKVIRDAVVAAIVAANTSAESRVFKNRVLPIKRVELPCVSVYAVRETSDDQGSGPRELKRTLQLAVEGYVEDGDDLDDNLDALALELERAGDADPTFGSVCSDSTLTGTQLDVGVSGQQPVGCVRLEYRVTYYTSAPRAADVTLDDFNTADIEIDAST